MRSIAESSDVSLKTLYNIFGNRDLLLLRVATERLGEMADNATVQKAGTGIAQLLAYGEGSMKLFAIDPEFSRITIGVLFQVDQNIAPVDSLIAQVRDITLIALNDAVKQGELPESTDVIALSHMLCAQQWGFVLMWEKGLMSLEQITQQILLSHCLTLLPLSTTKTKKWLDAKSKQILTKPWPQKKAAS